jgi:hypothetical protein
MVKAGATPDEGLHYSLTLVKAGAPTDLHHYAGALHLTHTLVPGSWYDNRRPNERRSPRTDRTSPDQAAVNSPHRRQHEHVLVDVDVQDS